MRTRRAPVFPLVCGGYVAMEPESLSFEISIDPVNVRIQVHVAAFEALERRVLTPSRSQATPGARGNCCSPRPGLTLAILSIVFLFVQFLVTKDRPSVRQYTMWHLEAESSLCRSTGLPARCMHALMKNVPGI